MQHGSLATRIMAASWLAGALIIAGCTPDTRDTDLDAVDDTDRYAQQNGAYASDSDAMATANSYGGANANMPLDDAQIAHVAMTANRLDSTGAAAVVDRLNHADVKAFAQRMMLDHGVMMDSLRSVTARLGSGATGNEITTSLEQMAARPLDGTGSDLDRAYMDKEVMLHTQLLRTIDETLMPQTRDASLRTLVERMRAVVATHLRDAESIRSQLASH